MNDRKGFNSYAATVTRMKRLKQTWKNMNYRCYGKHNSKKTQRCYQDKGISVCDDWRNSFEAFYDWAVENGYDDGLTIDRINPDGDYCPDNCRWITFSENRSHGGPYAKYIARAKTEEPALFDNILVLCAERRISLARLEREAGLGNATIVKWTVSSPRANTVKKVADYFGITMDELLGFDSGKKV